MELTNESRWPNKIPAGTSIPAWAFLDVVGPDAFNVSAAETVAAQGAPESSALPSATSATASGSSSTATNGDPTTAPASSSKKSNVGPIVGGVIGGVGGAAILAGIIAFFVLRHRRKARAAPSAAFMPAPTAPDYVPQSPAPYNSEKPYDPSVPYGAPVFAGTPPPTSTMNTSMPSMAVYDPNDPSTFPTAASTLR